ncbi:hypothetical protein NDU88_008184 [Pleurodeles waltl]|uniref:Uncharacterized protein n=1 Tax=Pleurodeles waltl TaxID=8319 RepID=A0AAV7SUY2_PLEWA|nr:hypothetical protein NDU88_008184 [Pleurodeles waltl]
MPLPRAREQRVFTAVPSGYADCYLQRHAPAPIVATRDASASVSTRAPPGTLPHVVLGARRGAWRPRSAACRRQ